MGCWNGTCLVSNLPIYAGDPVVFFILKRRRDVNTVEGGHYYVDDLYQPLLYPVVGEYDDYGCIGNVKEDFSLIEEYFEKVELSEPVWDKDNDVFRRIERGYYEGYSFAMVHKDIYDAMVEMGNRVDEWWTRGKSVRDHTVDNMEKKINEYFRHKATWEKIKGIVEDAPTTSLFETPDIIGGKDSRDFFVARYLNTKDEKLRNKMIEAHLFQYALSSCRKFWFPQTGAGSQNSEVELYEVIANKTLEICKQTKERWEE